MQTKEADIIGHTISSIKMLQILMQPGLVGIAVFHYYRVISGGGEGDSITEGQFIGGFPDNVLLGSQFAIRRQ